MSRWSGQAGHLTNGRGNGLPAPGHRQRVARWRPAAALNGGMLINPPHDGWDCRGGANFFLHVNDRPDARREFAEAVVRGLQAAPRCLDSRYLYDDEGSDIFERITEQPEYYQTRTEERLLAAAAADIRERVGDVSLVELGSGSSAKTRRLLEAWCERGASRYVPIDISGGMLETACRDLAATFPELAVEGIAASYERALPLIGMVSPLLMLFLGSTIGNSDRPEIAASLETIASNVLPGDRLLLGVDLVKGKRQLEAAYNDAAGWTARFTTNLFARMNRELGSRVPLDAVEHVAFYNERLERIEIYARFRRRVDIDVPLLERSFRIEPGEMIRTEISCKFRVDDVEATAARYGLMLETTYRDAEDLFAVLLLRRAECLPA
jgi:L-histidine N-alpha-methyltransferase